LKHQSTLDSSDFSAASHRTRIKVDPQFIVATIYSHNKTS
jgi:hypothetical protein